MRLASHKLSVKTKVIKRELSAEEQEKIKHAIEHAEAAAQYAAEHPEAVAASDAAQAAAEPWQNSKRERSHESPKDNRFG